MSEDERRFTAATAERRLDLFLTNLLPGRSRSEIARLIRSGAVTLNGSPTKASARVDPGDSIVVTFPEPEPADPAPEPMDIDFIHREESFVVLNKAAPLSVHPGAGRRLGTLVGGLLAALPGLSTIGGRERPGIVHRLDRDTSGVMVVALNDTAHRSIAESFQMRRVEKIYVAVVRGRPGWNERVLSAPIGRNSRDRKKMAVHRAGRESITSFRVIRSGTPRSVVLARPKTGRTHQIRVHLSHLGYPVEGDHLYGGRRVGNPIGRHALHAWILRFPHPVTGEHLSFTAPLPDDMVDLILRYGFAPPTVEEADA